MISIITLFIDNAVQKLTKPELVKWLLVILLAIFILSQLSVFYFIIPGKIRRDISVSETLNALQNFKNIGLVENWANLMTAVSVICLKAKLIVVILSILIFLAGWFIIYIIPKEWFEIGGILVVLFLFACPFVILGVIIFEILPFYLTTGFFGSIG